MNDIDMLLERVVALLGMIERDYDEGRDPAAIMRDHIDSIVNLRHDAAEMRKELAKK